MNPRAIVQTKIRRRTTKSRA